MPNLQEGFLDHGESSHGVTVRPTQGLWDDMVHHTKLDQLRRCDLQSFCCLCSSNARQHAKYIECMFAVGLYSLGLQPSVDRQVVGCSTYVLWPVQQECICNDEISLLTCFALASADWATVDISGQLMLTTLTKPQNWQSVGLGCT